MFKNLKKLFLCQALTTKNKIQMYMYDVSPCLAKWEFQVDSVAIVFHWKVYFS